MFVSSDQQCAGLPNSTDPASSAAVAAETAANTSLVDQVLAKANNQWLSLLSRSWQSYASFGPQIGIQLLNGQPSINAASQAKGIIVTGPGGSTPVNSNSTLSASPSASGGSAGGPGSEFGEDWGFGPVDSSPSGSQQRGSVTQPALTPDDIAFARYFGTTPRFQTYTGPLPPHGTARALTMGGQNRALPVGPGRYPAATPERRFGTAPQCMSVPASIASSIASGDGSMTMLGIIGLVALAGLGYVANKMEKKHGRGRF